MDTQQLFADLYVDLKRLAHARLRACGDRNALNTTALVHESFLKLAERGAVPPQNRPAFFAYVGKVMRSVVLDGVRERRAKKRGGHDIIVTLTTDVAGEPLDDDRLLAVDEAAERARPAGAAACHASSSCATSSASRFQISEMTGKAVRTLERDSGQSARIVAHADRGGMIDASGTIRCGSVSSTPRSRPACWRSSMKRSNAIRPIGSVG
jgi:hypothetical protein